MTQRLGSDAIGPAPFRLELWQTAGARAIGNIDEFRSVTAFLPGEPPFYARDACVLYRHCATPHDDNADLGRPSPLARNSDGGTSK